MSDLIKKDISHELWRKYSWNDDAHKYEHKIVGPKWLYIRPGGTTHRVVNNAGISHCVPSVGGMGCVLTWETPAEKEPVNF